MINGGYILQPRLFDSSEAAKMPPVARELWLYLLRNVNHTDNGKYKRGQGFFNLEEIRESLCWYSGYRKNTYSKSQLTKSLRRLREGKMVVTAKATRGVYVTICNYEYYQDPKNYEGTNEDQTKETRRKRKGSTKNKNDKNKEKRIYIAAVEIFDFWNCQKIIVHKNKKDFIPYIKAKLENNYTPGDLKEAMNNYGKILKSDKHYWTYKWGLKDFLVRKGAIDKFLTINAPFENFKKDKNTEHFGNGKTSREAEEEMAIQEQLKIALESRDQNANN